MLSLRVPEIQRLSARNWNWASSGWAPTALIVASRVGVSTPFIATGVRLGLEAVVMVVMVHLSGSELGCQFRSIGPAHARGSDHSRRQSISGFGFDRPRLCATTRGIKLCDWLDLPLGILDKSFEEPRSRGARRLEGRPHALFV
jgi:hypothetical protein